MNPLLQVLQMLMQGGGQPMPAQGMQAPAQAMPRASMQDAVRGRGRAEYNRIANEFESNPDEQAALGYEGQNFEDAADEEQLVRADERRQRMGYGNTQQYPTDVSDAKVRVRPGDTKGELDAVTSAMHGSVPISGQPSALHGPNDGEEWLGDATTGPTKSDFEFVQSQPTDTNVRDFENYFGVRPDVSESWDSFRKRWASGEDRYDPRAGEGPDDQDEEDVTAFRNRFNNAKRGAPVPRGFQRGRR